MTRIYFAIIDTTKPNDSVDFAWYDSIPYMNDLAGHVVDFARKNGTDPKDIRLYIFPKKSIWEQQKHEYYSRYFASSQNA